MIYSESRMLKKKKNTDTRREEERDKLGDWD